MITYDQLRQQQSAFEVVEAGFAPKDVTRKAKELLEECKRREVERGEIKVPHPKLPNTWLMVSKEKAKQLGVI